MIDIKGLDKLEVLQALYQGARPQGMGFIHFAPGPLTEEELETIGRQMGSGYTYFDYLKGRVMKVDLDKDVLDPRLYDRDNGSGAARRALQSAGLIC